MGIKIVIFTHSNYSWVWPLCIGQTQKYMSGYVKYVMLNNTASLHDFNTWLNAGYAVITYNESDSYKERVSSCLNFLNPEDILLFYHEDMFLDGIPNFEILEKFTKLVLENKADVIKLIAAGDVFIKSNYMNELYYNPYNLKFAIQPSLIKTKKLKLVYDSATGNDIWSLESSMFHSPAISENKSFFCYNGESKRGSAHYNSSIYPYIATAVVKGKWNLSEYGEELNRLFKEYNINV